ncbi:hypothetical protein TNCV_4239381 [Trichonephila clavipes]|nr:hypothetical protein TNCV_4239381 [Trichonephila clavipes]
MTEKAKETLALFVGKCLRSIFGGLNCPTIWSKRTNLEIDKLFKQPNIIKFTAIQSLKWARYMIRLDDKRSLWPGHVVRLWWIDCLEKELKTINVRNWKSRTKNRTAWNGILRKAKAH